MGLKDQLEAAGYDTSEIDENSIIQKLEAAGYDTAPLQQKPSLLERLKGSGESAIAGGKAAVKAALNPKSALPVINAGMNKSNEGYQMMGEAAAEKLGAAGHPLIGGAVGGTIANANNIAAAASGIADAPVLAQGARAVGGLIKAGPQAVMSKLSNAADVLFRPGERASRAMAEQMTSPARQSLEAAKIGIDQAKRPTPELLNLQNKLADAPDAYAKLETSFNSKLEKLKSAASAAEKKAGLTIRSSEYIKNIVENPAKLEASSAKLGRLVEKGPKFMAEHLSPETLYREMKLAQTALESPGLNQIQARNFNEFNKVAKEALGQSHPELAASLKEMGKVFKVLGQIPKRKAAQVASLRSQVKQATNALRSQKVSWEQKEEIARKQLADLQPQVEKLIQDGILTTDVRKKIGWTALGLAGLGSVRKFIPGLNQ